MKLNVKQVNAGYGPAYILEDINLQINKGDLLTIIGPNGSGKSTLLKCISRSLKPKTGAVLLNGKSIFHTPTKKVAAELAVLPQLHQAPGDITVWDLVSYGRYPHQGFTGILQTKDVEIIKDAIALTNIEDLQHRPVATLSGGERQRAWIAMVLAQQTNVLILDEPTTFLDISHQIEILELIHKLNREHRLTIIMVLHDINQAVRYSDTIVVLKDKRIHTAGPSETILSSELLRDVYNINAKIITDTDLSRPFFIPLSNTGVSDA